MLNDLELIKLKKKFRLMVVALVGCAVLLLIFIAATIFFYKLQASNPLLKNKVELNFYLPENLAQNSLPLKKLSC